MLPEKRHAEFWLRRVEMARIVTMATSKSKISFEDIYRQLEEKAALLEQGGLSLDDSLAAYEDAVSLAQRCQQMLDSAELRITRLRETVAAAPEEEAELDAAGFGAADDGEEPELL